ncbi:MAG: hypothetical protein ABMA14_22710, partial [Hyphomonadaceae bacterium]
ALLLSLLLAGCSTAPPISAQEVAPDSYAAADIAAIQKEADDLDIDQIAERMDAMRDGVWKNKAPVPPADVSVSIDLIVSSSFARYESSTLLWRTAAGGWDWHRAVQDGAVPEADARPPAGGALNAAQASELDHMLADPQRRAEVWYSPPTTPLKGTDETNACFDGASSLMVIRRPGQANEFIVQSCRTRWLNGQLINLIGGIGRG